MIVNNGALILKICNILFLYSLSLIFIKLVLNLILIDTPKATIKDNNITCNGKNTLHITNIKNTISKIM